MKKFLQESLTFLLFVASIVCFYWSLTAFFASLLLNIITFFAGVFLLVQAAGFVDKAKGFGQNPNSNSNNNDDTTLTSGTVNKDDDTPDNYEGDDEI